MLTGAALLVTAGVLNFVQRVQHETPPWDGEVSDLTEFPPKQFNGRLSSPVQIVPGVV